MKHFGMQGECPLMPSGMVWSDCDCWILPRSLMVHGIVLLLGILDWPTCIQRQF